MKEYTIGDRKFSVLVLAATIFATYINANNTVGHVDRMYQKIFMAMPLLLTPLFWFLTYRIYAKNIFKFKNCISISEIMGQMYGNSGRYITFVINTVIGVGILSVQAIAIGQLCQYLNISTYKAGMLVIMSILTIYSCLGGVRLVAITDVFQFFVFFIVFPIFTGALIHKNGGFNMVATNFQNSFHISFDFKIILQMLCTIFHVLLPVSYAPYVQRMLMGKNETQLRSTFILVGLLTFAFNLVLIIITFAIKIHTDSSNPTFGLYEILSKDSSPVIQGLMIIGLLSIIISSADSWLNSTSSLVVSDLMFIFCRKPLSDKKQLLFARISTLFLSLCAVIIAIATPKMLQVFYVFINFYYPVLFPALSAGFLGYKLAKSSFFTGIMDFHSNNYGSHLFNW